MPEEMSAVEGGGESAVGGANEPSPVTYKAPETHVEFEIALAVLADESSSANEGPPHPQSKE